MSLIVARDLAKSFWIKKRRPGLQGAFRDLIAPQRTELRAVDGITFSIAAGEVVGYLGPNGAGKSTTIKMLTGILFPTSGTLEVLGLSPQRHRIEVARNIGVVFGQRSQLYWDLRLGESFKLLKYLYEIDGCRYRDNIEWAHEKLAIGRLIDKPVRQLSLGERMRAELVASILHSPAILFFDEPTIGLDFEAREAMRDMIRSVNQDRKTTVILTTHDLSDVEQLCQRLIIINHGRIVQDGRIGELMSRFAPYRTLAVECTRADAKLFHPMAEVTAIEGMRTFFQFDRRCISAAQLIADITSQYPIRDLTVKEPNIESLIRHIYRNSGSEPGMSAASPLG